jgi:hypothetical protein
VGRENEDGVMKQILTFDLDELTAALDVKENGKEVSYSMRLTPDRSLCAIVKTTFDDMESGDPVGQEAWERSLDELKDDGAQPHHLLWAVRGMWGIPLEFTGPKTSRGLPENDPGETAASAPLARRPSKNRS